MEYSSTASEIHVFPQISSVRKSHPSPVNISGNNFNLHIELLAKRSFTSIDNIIEECLFDTKCGDKYNSLSWNIVDTVLTNFPYPLERVKWDGLEKILENKHDLIKQILDFAHTLQNVTPPFQDDDYVCVNLTIVKKIYVSPQEFKLTKGRIVKEQYEDISLIIWGKIDDVFEGLGRYESSLFEELQWLEGCIKDFVRDKDRWSMHFDDMFYFDENYERELLQTLTEQVRRKFRSLPAVRSIMQFLQRVNPPENKSTDECSICMRSYLPDSEAYSMPCSHSFHFGCIETWLLKNPSCPVCRYKLPPSESK